LHRPPLLARINWYWTFQLAGWGALTLFNSVYGGSSQLRIVVTISCWGSLGGLLLSHLWRGVLRRRGWVANGLRWQRIVPSLIVLAAIQTASVTAAFHVMYPPDVLRGIAWLPGALLFWFGVFLTWTVFYFTALSLRRASRFEAEALRLEVLAKDAQLRALQAQVNPHFFFNSLNSVRALIFEDREAAAHMIDQLANLMRHALQSSQRDGAAVGRTGRRARLPGDRTDTLRGSPARQLRHPPRHRSRARTAHGPANAGGKRRQIWCGNKRRWRRHPHCSTAYQR
jgi:hypothetical protein